MGVSVFNIAADAMHFFDLGLTHFILGNVMFEMCYEDHLFPMSPSPSSRCQALWDKVM